VGEREYGPDAEAAISAKLRECRVRFLVVAPSAIPEAQATLIRELNPPMNDHPGQKPRWRIDEVRAILGVSPEPPETDRETSVTTLSSRSRRLAEVEAFLGVAGLKVEIEPIPLGPYRYVWRLVWDPNKSPLLVVGLMPSTADDDHADATVAKLIAIAAGPHPEVGEAEGFGELVMMNMFARRPMPSHRRAALNLEFVDPVGDNDAWISREAETVRVRRGTVVAAWGGDGWSRHGIVLSLLGGAVCCFGMTQALEAGGIGFPLSASRSRVDESAALLPYLDDRASRRLMNRALEEHNGMRQSR
jgi:hypothetical protein